MVQWMRRLLPQRGEKRSSQPVTMAQLLDLLRAPSKTNAGAFVDETTALNFSAVWCAVAQISGDIGSMPCVLYESQQDGSSRRAVGQRLYGLLHDAPNGFMTAAVFWETFIQHVLTWGNGYAEIERNAGGDPVALWLLPPNTVNPMILDGRLVYSYYGRRGPIVFAAHDVFHVPGLGFDGLKGYSRITKARESLGAAFAAEAFGSRFFGNGALPGLVVRTEGELSATAKENLRQSIKSTVGGANQLGVLILEEGLTVDKIGIPPEDAQFLETRRFGIEEVARWFNMPLAKLRGESGNVPGGNFEAQQIGYLTDTLRPPLVKIEQEIRRKLTPEPPGKYYGEFLVDGLLRADALTRARVYTMYKTMGVMTPELIADKENLPRPSPAVDQEPEPTPTREIGLALRAIVRDIVSRSFAVEANGCRRAAEQGPAAVEKWAERFYAEQPKKLAGLVSETMRAWADLDRHPIAVEPLPVVSSLLQAHREQVLDLPAATMQRSLSELEARWLRDEAEAWAAQLIPLERSGA